ncbi:MAG: tRNA lysidine(34) synthetase TilS [Calditrichaeota bacterium]|nr:tRNA lysidine(34) synthetase TilS [Calditrichota bacterium]
MSDLFQQFISFVEKNQLVGANEHVLAAVSGGVDSAVLFDLMWRFSRTRPVKLGVVHLNHGIRGQESDEDEAFVRELAKKYDVPFYCEKVDVPAFSEKEGYATEEAARILRYQFFENVFRETKADKIALGHHADDQAETVIMHFFRGSGPAGLSGMAPQREKFVRPLLFATRGDIENYAEIRKLNFRLDSSNFDLAYKRNRIRHELLPYLRNYFNAGIDSSLLRTQKIMAEIDAFLRRQAAIALETCAVELKKDKIILEIDTFLSYFVIIQKYMIFSVLERLGVERFSLSSEKLERIVTRIQQKKIGKKEILSGDVQALIDRSVVVFQRGKIKFFEMVVEPNQRYPLPDGSAYLKLTLVPRDSAGGLFSESKNMEFADWEKVCGKLKMRSLRAGDRFFPLNFAGQKKVADFLSDLKVPLHRRSEIPVLECDAGIIWLVGYRLDDRFKVTDRTTQLLKIEIVEKSDAE